jgi:hypothetical protein
MWPDLIYCPRIRLEGLRFKKKVKLSLLTYREGPQGCEKSKILHFLDNRLTDGGETVSLTRRPAALYPPERFLALISVRG